MDLVVQVGEFRGFMGFRVEGFGSGGIRAWVPIHSEGFWG